MNQNNIIFIDIETIPAPDLPEELKPECKLGNLKDLAKIEIKKKEWETDPNGQIKAMSVSPWMNKIVCIEMYQSWNNEFSSKYGNPNIDSERWYLDDFWDIQENYTTLLVGFNILNFDIPTIINRSMLLGVTPTVEIPLRRYSRYPVYDMAMILCGWDISKLKKFNWYLKRFGLPDKTGDGSQVYGWHQAGEHQKISDYCKADVLACKALFEKMIDYYPLPRNYDKEQYDNG